MMETVLYFIHYGLLLVFGILLSFAFAGISPDKKNIFIGSALFAFCGLCQIIILLLHSEGIVWYLYPLITHVPLLMVLCLIYRKKLVSALACVCSAYLCCQLPKWLGMMSTLFTDNPSAEQIVRIISLIISGYILIRYLSGYISEIFSKDTVSVLIFGTVPMVYYLFDYSMGIYTDFWHENNRVAVEFLPFFLCIIYFAFCTVYYKEYEQKSAALRKEQIIRITAQQQQKEIDSIRKAEKETRIIRHDMRHFLSIIAAALNENDIDSARKIVENLSSKVEKAHPHQYCSNIIINHILSSYKEKCAAFGIDLRSDVDFNINIEDEIVFSSILSNGLDNAVKAVSALPEGRRRITLMIKTSGGKLLLSIKNPYLQKPVLADGMPVSEAAGHGYGTQSIKYLTEKAGGNCQFSVTDEYFLLRVVL